MADNIERQLQELLDREEIKELRHLYCYHVDQGRFADCFELWTKDDPVGEFPPLGSFRGSDAVRKFYCEAVPATFPFMQHYVTNHTIRVEDGYATGKCYFEFKGTVASGEAWVGSGWYDDELVKVDGRWKFKRRKANFVFFLPVSEGWGAREKVQLSRLQDG